MTVRIYPGGTGGTLGDELITQTELYSTGDVYYVHHTGDDTSNGITRQKPWSSLVYALTVAVDCDIIVLLDGHTEEITASRDIDQNGLKIVGEGSSSGEPTVTLTSTLTTQSWLILAGTNITLGNIKFAAGTTTAVGKVYVSGARSMVRGCRFELGADDGWFGLEWDAGATGARCYDTTFVSVSTTTAPQGAIGSHGPTDCELEAVTIDGGTTGMNGGFVDASVFAGTAPERLRAQQMRLLNGASFLTGDDTTGYIGIAEKSGGPLVQGFSRHLAAGFQQTGDALLADTEIYMSGDVYYVNFADGDDGNSGTSELEPKQTVNGALSVLSDDCSIVVLLPNHDESTSTIAIPLPGTTIIGCGTSGGRPTCKLHSPAADPIIVMGQTSYLRNIWVYDVESESGPETLVESAAEQCELRGCLLTPRVNATIGASTVASFSTYRETTFESAGSADQRPAQGLSFRPSAPFADVDVRGCVFANATLGFSSFAFAADEDVARLYVIGMTLSHGADVFISGDTTGLVNPETTSGSSSVEW